MCTRDHHVTHAEKCNMYVEKRMNALQVQRYGWAQCERTAESKITFVLWQYTGERDVES